MAHAKYLLAQAECVEKEILVLHAEILSYSQSPGNQNIYRPRETLILFLVIVSFSIQLYHLVIDSYTLNIFCPLRFFFFLRF